MRPGRNTVAYALMAAGIAVAAVPATAGAASTASTAAGAAAADPGAGSVIAYAKAQLGKPYVYGATGPDEFDCSGLALRAYQSAGISIERTSQEQWASEPRIPASAVKPGDLVFFAGGDGTPTAPGHVGIVVDPAKDIMIDAYATGTPVAYHVYGPSATLGGLSPVVGFTRP
jgi:cell wall-associated NlpC family hydrolase